MDVLMPELTREQMQEEIRRLRPFRHNLRLPYGLQTAPPESQPSRQQHDARIDTLIRHAFPALLKECGGSLEGLRVLDLGCNSGGFSVEAHKRGAEYVLGLDGVDRYIEQAAFVKTALDIGDSVEFRNVGVYDLDPDEVGRFDVTFFFGLLYHLENPVLAMRKVSAVTDHVLVVDTNTILAGDKQETPLWRMSFPSPVTSPDDPLASTGLWRNQEYCELKPNAAAVTGLLKLGGFDRVRLLAPTADGLPEVYQNGRRKTFLAVKGTA